MKVTPLEIRQKAFEKQFRGYDSNEVNAFLLSLSQEWERMLDESKELRIKLEASEKEVSKLREVENSLFKTLKTAEDTGANVVEQARMTAALQVKEAHLNADAIVSEARTKAKIAIEEAEKRARDVLSEMENRARSLADACNKLETQRDTFVSEMRHVAEDILERIAKVKKASNGVDMDQQIARMNNEMNHIFSSNGQHGEPEKQTEPLKAEEVPVVQPEPAKMEMEESLNSKTGKSFFDEIG